MRRGLLLTGLLALGACNLGHADAVYVARRGWHVDVGFAMADLAGGGLQPIAQRFPEAKFVFFGFGDRRYLTSHPPRSRNLSAAILPGAGLILVTAIGNEPEQGFGAGRVVRLEVTRDTREALESHVAAAFQDDASGPKILEPGPYDASLYVEARPRYSAVHTCNTWVAEILQQSGLPIRSRGVIFASQIWGRVQRLSDTPQGR